MLRWILLYGIAIVLMDLPVSAKEPAATTWKAGVAKVNITPDKPLWMSGYAGRDKPAEGKLTDLWAKALVLEDPRGHKAVLITMDLIGIDREISVNVCGELKKKFGLNRDAVFLNTSHTHTGPVVGNNLNMMYFLDEAQQKLVAEYTQGLQDKLVKVAGEAMEKLAPARIAWANGFTTYAVNRRTNFATYDVNRRPHTEADVPKLRELGQLKGPVDHEVPVLSVRDPEGKLLAVAFGYACHSTVLASMQWSGDHPGFAQINLEKAHPEAIALFWAGCGGDQNPLPRRTVAHAEAYGKQLADAVDAVLNAPMKPVEGNLMTAYAEVDAPLAQLPTREKIVEDSTAKDKYVAGRAKYLLKQMEKEPLKDSYPYPVQVWQLGPDLTWVTLGGEVVVDFSLRLKKELGPGKTWVAGYSNDVMAYIPSLRVLQEGGYEGGGAMIYYGLPTIWGTKIEEVIVAGVHDQVKKVKGKEQDK